MINHAHMKLGATGINDVGRQMKFSRGLMSRDWLPVSESTECAEGRMWESKDFIECADNTLLVASDGSGGSSEARDRSFFEWPLSR